MTEQHAPSFWRTRWGWLLIGFLVVAGYFLLSEHAAHVAGALPWLLLAACPLMHLFGHRHHAPLAAKTPRWIPQCHEQPAAPAAGA